MSHHATNQWLVTYDIADKKRLARVFRTLKKNGVPLQYSVFMVKATTAKFGILMAKINAMINQQADDIRAYCMPENGWSVSMGSSILPEGVLLDYCAKSKPIGLGQENAPSHGKQLANPLSGLIFSPRAV